MLMSIDGLSSDKTYDLIKKALTVSNVRSKVSANNIANINTAGYKAYAVSFEDTLNNTSESLDMKLTNDKHIQEGTSYGDYNITQDNTTSGQQNGNNVDIDNEMTNVAANALMYNALVTQMNSKLSLTKYIVSGGK